MTKLEALAADYWIENTQKIYDENLHISAPVMDAYKAGFQAAREWIIHQIFEYESKSYIVQGMGDEEDGN